MNKRKFYIYSLILFVIFIVSVSSSGLFKIGILSDTFGDAYTAVNSTAVDKLTNNLEYIDAFRYRPILFLTLKGIVGLNSIFGITYDNFIIYRLINLFLYLIFGFTAGIIVLKITSDIKLSVITETLILVYPNNLHNLCWSAAYFEILCGIFFLSAFLFVIKYLNNRSSRFLIYSNVLFILSLLTKEIAITLPFICLVILYMMHGKIIFKKYKSVYISQLSVLFFYFISKTFLSKGIPVISGKYFQDDFWINSIRIVFKGILSSVIPIDYSVLRKEIQEFNLLVVIFVLIVILFVAIVLIDLIKSRREKIYLLVGLNFLILLSPFIYAGYIRPQLILLPFTTTLILLANFNVIKSFFNNRFFFAIIVFWLFWGYGVINGWKTAYSEGKGRIENLLKTNFPSNKKINIIGNPARIQQYFMYDNVMFPYNYFKYHKFTIKDTISDIIRTVALDENSLNAELKVNKINNKEYEISCTGKTQFFYLDGDELQIKTNKGIKNEDKSIEFIEYNDLNKPVKIKFKILNDNIESYIFQGINLIKLN